MLLAYDGSAEARGALERVAQVAGPGDDVRVVNVMPEPGISSRLAPYTEERERQAQLLDEAEWFLAARGIDARRITAVGDAATEILAAAERMGADLVVLGRRHTRMPHPLGSVSGRVVRCARCDVLVELGAA